MEEYKSEVENIKEKLINIAIETSFYFLILALAGSIFRIFNTGWSYSYLGHIILSIAYSLIYFFRKKIPLNYKVHLYLTLFLIVSLFGSLDFKLLGGFYIIFMVITVGTLIMGGRTGITYFIIFVAGYILVYFLHATKILQSNINFNIYIEHTTSWIFILMEYTFEAAIIIYTSNKFYQVFTTTIKDLLQKSNKLNEAIVHLHYSDEQFRTFMDNYPYPIFIKDQSADYTYKNEALLHLLDQTNHGKENNHSEHVYTPANLIHEFDGYDNFITTKKESVEFNASYESPANQINYFKVIKFPLANQEGDTVIGGITINITDIRNAEIKVEQSDKKMYNVMIESEEHERERYAKELHDGLGPILSTCKIYIQTLGSLTDESMRKEHLKRTGVLLDDALQSIKEISNNLSPHILNNYGIYHAVNAFTEKLINVTNIKFTITTNIKCRLQDIYEITIYRALVELINNSVKYSQSTQINIDISIYDKVLCVQFSENGIGFDYFKVKSQNKGAGLYNLENRMRKIEGEYEYISQPGKGVKVKMIIKEIY